MANYILKDEHDKIVTQSTWDRKKGGVHPWCLTKACFEFTVVI